MTPLELAKSHARQDGLEANKRYFGENVPKGGAIAFLDGLAAYEARLKQLGFVLVPREASEEIGLAGSGFFDGETMMDRERQAATAWSAMIEAAARPSPITPPDNPGMVEQANQKWLPLREGR